jgi:membrane-associated protease RseP (regulator of RpoE activity)
LGERLHRFWIQAVLFLLTLYTTSAVGSRMAWNFANGLPVFRLEHDSLAFLSAWNDPRLLLTGLPFSLTLLGILLAHEFGHWCMCRHYGLDASLPYFLPAPTFIGTFGAFIRIRSIIYSRRELFDVGVAGPLAGFVLIVPAIYFGYAWSKVIPGVALRGDLVFGTPLIFRYFEQLIFPGARPVDLCLHPVAWAAWAGVFATALNLLPIGQLDGGHILYAWFGQRQLTLSKVFIALLVPLGFVYWPWWIWAVLLFIFGRKHPYIHDYVPLDGGRKALAVLAFVVFALCFMAAPVTIPGE